MSRKKTTLGDIEDELEQLSPETRSFISFEPLRKIAELFQQLKDLSPGMEFKTRVLYPRYEELLRETKRKPAYEKLHETCRRFGKDPSKHLPDDPEAFFRSYNRWKSRQLKKK